MEPSAGDGPRYLMVSAVSNYPDEAMVVLKAAMYSQTPGEVEREIHTHFRPVMRVMLSVFWLAVWASAQIPDAQTHPHCTALTGPGSCDWKQTNGVGPGVRVVLSDRTGGHDQSKLYLRDALTRLSAKYGFTLTRINDLNDITEAYLQNAKVIIFSNGDGDSGGSIPNDSVRTRVETFVKQNGWGMILVHAACAYIRAWPFQKQACIQQYNHQNEAGTQATLYVENRTVDGSGHGRANPHTAFFLAGLPDSVRMSDEWMNWGDSPLATTHVDTVPILNKIMLLRLNEDGMTKSGIPVSARHTKYGPDHYLVWTQTQGNGITLFHSFGHDDTYQQDGTRKAYGDSLLWRELRYAAKDWDTVSSLSLIASRIRPHFSLSGNTRSISLSFGDAARVSVSIVDIAGREVFTHTYNGEKSAEIQGLSRGVYFVNLVAGRERQSRRVTLY